MIDNDADVDERDEDAILEEARERFERVQDDDKDNRDDARADFHFVYTPGHQWDDEVKAKRSQWKEPCLEFNQLKQFVHQVVNDQRQNRPGIRIHPANGRASEDAAEIRQGLIRAIEYQSKAESVYDTGYQGAVVGGRGWWRIGSEYENPNSFNQRIKIESIQDPFTVYADNDYREPDGSDRDFVFVVESVPKDEFKRLYPDADAVSWNEVDARWRDDDNILVADYYRRICRKRTLVAMSDGAVGYKDEMPPVPEGIVVVSERETETYEIEWFKIAGGNQILEEFDCPGDCIPVICCSGDEFVIDGKRVFQGLIRHARDPQRMLNYGMTQQATHLALSPKAPWLAAEGQIEGYENIWKNANRENFSVLPYKPTTIDGTPVPPPSRIAPSMPDAGWLNWTQQQIGMIKSTIGMYENSLGQRNNEQSGRAILAREKQGDNATFHYVDNLSRAIALTGRIINNWIPTYYDTERIVHIIGRDDVRKMVTINQASVDGALNSIRLNDMTEGEYAVTVEAGPSYATKRQETADLLTQLVQAYPPLMQVAGDLVVGAQEIPNADMIAERLRAMLPPPIQQILKAEQQGGKAPDPATLAAMAQKDQQLQQAQAILQKMGQELQAAKSGAQEKMLTAQIDAQLERERMQFEAQTQQAKAQADAEIALQKANVDAKVALQKSQIEQATSIRKAVIERATKLEIAQIEAGVELHALAVDAQNEAIRAEAEEDRASADVRVAEDK